jgi:hypothetical protein
MFPLAQYTTNASDGLSANGVAPNLAGLLNCGSWRPGPVRGEPGTVELPTAKTANAM